jgi:hypothetical protein
MNHSEARQKVCIICYNKASRPLSALDIDGIQKYVIENYNAENLDLPCGICSPCHGILTQHRKGDTHKPFPVVGDYNPGTRILTRANSVCTCRICAIAKANGLTAKSLKKKRGRPFSELPKKKVKLCSNCLAIVYQGCNHSQAHCNSKKQKLANISGNVLSDDMTKQQVTSYALKDLSSGDAKAVKLSTLGKPLCVSIEPKKCESQATLSATDVISMKVNANLSDRQLFQILRDFRLKFGRQSVESNVKSVLSQRKSIFKDLFSQETIEFKDSKDNPILRPFVFCHDTQEFIERILLLRGDTDVHHEDKIGFDDGKQILKLTLTVFDPENKVPMQTLPSARTTRAQGIGAGPKFVDTGVNKLFILAAAPNTPENYENCRLFLEKTLIKNVSFHFAADLKMSNICLGIMSHASLHPCPYCEGTKNVFEEDAPSRTFDTISDNHQKWQEESGKKSSLKHYYNCANEPLLIGNHDTSTAVLDIVPPPSLHIKLGIVNKLYAELLKLFPGLDQWPQDLYIIKESYHGQTFEGNECNRLLQNLDMLSNILPANLSNFLDCFHAFRDAMQACFGSNLEPDYRDKIMKFERSYNALKLSTTTKVHIMNRHVPEFIQKHGRPLGQFSEQAVEHCHAKFDRFFNCYRIKDIKHTSYLSNLFRAVMHFNAYHI